MSKAISELPVMAANCKTCPFKANSAGHWQDVTLASTVIERTLFKGQQICHGTEGPNRESRNRCKGAFDYCREIYTRMGQPDLITKEPRSIILTHY